MVLNIRRRYFNIDTGIGLHRELFFKKKKIAKSVRSRLDFGMPVSIMSLADLPKETLVCIRY